MKKHLYFLLLFLFSSLHGEKEPVYIPYVHELQRFYAMKMHTFGFQLVSVSGCLMNDIEKIGLGFYINKPVNVDEARRFYLTYAEIFRKSVNLKPKMRPYLHKYPVTLEELKFSLSFPSNPNSNPSSVAHVFNSNGEICYFATHAKEIHHESYNEATKRFDNEKLYNKLIVSHPPLKPQQNLANFDDSVLKECPPMHLYEILNYHKYEDISFNEMVNEIKVRRRQSQTTNSKN